MSLIIAEKLAAGPQPSGNRTPARGSGAWGDPLGRVELMPRPPEGRQRRETTSRRSGGLPPSIPRRRPCPGLERDQGDGQEFAGKAGWRALCVTTRPCNSIGTLSSTLAIYPAVT